MFMLVQIYLQCMSFNWQNKYEEGKQNNKTSLGISK